MRVKDALKLVIGIPRGEESLSHRGRVAVPGETARILLG